MYILSIVVLWLPQVCSFAPSSSSLFHPKWFPYKSPNTNNVPLMVFHRRKFNPNYHSNLFSRPFHAHSNDDDHSDDGNDITSSSSSSFVLDDDDVAVASGEGTSCRSFEDLGLASSLVTRLNSLGFMHPTEIQSASWASTRDGSGAVLMAPTGCG